MAGYPIRYIVVDTETVDEPDPEKPGVRSLTMRLGCAKIYDPTCPSVSCPEYFEFTSTDEFNEWLSILPYHTEPIYIFAHNMGFDSRILGVFRSLATGGLSLEPPNDWERARYYQKSLAVLENSPFILRTFRRDGQIFLWLDTVQWFLVSLKDLGDSMGLAKMPQPSEDAPEHEWARYCRGDVDCLDHALRRLWGWLQDMHCHVFHYTRAGQAMHLWRTRYGKSKIKPPEDPSVLWMDRHAYYAGRTALFRVGDIEGPCWKLDVNSMYPYVMRNSVFPTSIKEINNEPGQSPPSVLTHPLGTTAEVWLESPTVSYPVRAADGTHWCIGHVRTVLCGPELRQALDRGHVAYVGRWIRYDCEGLFRAFVDLFHGMRLRARSQGDRATDLMCKLLMNSLQGKFGQRTGEWHDLGQTHAPGYYGAGKVIGTKATEDVEYRIIAGRESMRVKDQEDPKSFVPISAYVASYGRVLMDTFRAQLPADEVYYQCVDSLLVGFNAHQWFVDNKLIDPNKLGWWKESGPWDQVTIHGVGTIDLGDTRQRMGIKASAVEISPEVWKVEEWESLPSALGAGHVAAVNVVGRLKAGVPSVACVSCDANGWTRWPQLSNWDVPPEKQKTLPLGQGRHRRR